jgi:type IX secretion system PorP/SprF family membrane protein
MKMKNLKAVIIFAMGLMASNQSFGQQDPMYSQYMFNMLSVNPAYAGSRDVLSATMLYRRQWVGIQGAPNTISFSADMPIKNEKIGLGINLTDDRLGIMHNSLLGISYAYRIRLTSRGTLAFGLQAGVNQYKADYGSVDPSQNTSTSPDLSFNGNVTQIFPNIGFGVYYTTDKFYIGTSVPKLIKNSLSDYYDPSINFTNFANRENRHFFIMAGYVLPLNDALKLKPSMLLKVVHGAPLEFDVNANLWIHNVIALGLSYRTGDSIDALFELQATPQFRFGYAYDMTTTNLGRYNSGSHELMIRYEFGYNRSKMLSPRYF